MLNILAGMQEGNTGGQAPDTFDERIKIMTAQRTPTNRASETNEGLAEPEEKESAEAAFAKAMGFWHLSSMKCSRRRHTMWTP